MKLPLRALALLPCTALLLAVAPTAYADITSATVYENTPDAGNAGDPLNFASTLPNATFSIGSLGIDFVSGSDYEVGTFLNNPTFLNQHNGFSSTATADNMELVIVGTTFLNAGANSFQVGHDDGVVLTIPGIGFTLNDGGPTSFTTTPFTVTNPGAAGVYSFTLDYAECCGAPADLLFTVDGAPITSGSAPEPSSLILMGTGVLAFAGMVRRRIFA